MLALTVSIPCILPVPLITISPPPTIKLPARVVVPPLTAIVKASTLFVASLMVNLSLSTPVCPAVTFHCWSTPDEFNNFNPLFSPVLISVISIVIISPKDPKPAKLPIVPVKVPVSVPPDRGKPPNDDRVGNVWSPVLVPDRFVA